MLGCREEEPDYFPRVSYGVITASKVKENPSLKKLRGRGSEFRVMQSLGRCS